MKICHIISGHYRHDIRVFQKECISLAAKGYDVTLLCSDGQEDEIINEVTITSIPQIPRNRIHQFLGLTKVFLIKAIEINAEIYHIHEPFLLGVAVKLKKMGKKVIFDSHEDTPNDITQKKYIPLGFRHLIAGLYSLKEKKALKKMDAAICVTPKIVERFKKINPNTYMITNYPIYTDEKMTSEYMQREDALCFAGQATAIWNNDVVLDAIESVDIKFRFAGINITEDFLESIKQKQAFEKMSIYSGLSPKEVREFIYDKSTIGVAMIHYNKNMGDKEGSLGITKIFEYMMAGLPLICTDFKLWKTIIAEGQCGICIPPTDTEKIKEAILYLKNHKEEAYKMGERGKQLVKEKYNWEQQEQILFKVYEQILK